MTRQIKKKGQETKDLILDEAVQLASIFGLEGITIGMLSSELNMSKSGLIGLFGTKEDLQLAVLQRAVDIFQKAVIEPIDSYPHGEERFLKLVEQWIMYIEKDTFRGGCFFTATASEYDSRPGEVRDQLVKAVRLGLDFLETEAMKCLTSKDEDSIKQLVFEVHSILLGVNMRYKLFRDTTVFDQARIAVSHQLQTVNSL